jgi:hypothetical protein
LEYGDRWEIDRVKRRDYGLSAPNATCFGSFRSGFEGRNWPLFWLRGDITPPLRKLFGVQGVQDPQGFGKDGIAIMFPSRSFLILIHWTRGWGRSLVLPVFELIEWYFVVQFDLHWFGQRTKHANVWYQQRTHAQGKAKFLSRRYWEMGSSLSTI